MTAPTIDAPADSSTGGEGATTGGQAPAGSSNGSTSPAGPGQHEAAREGGDGPRGRRADGEQVRNAARDDDGPQDDGGEPGTRRDDEGKAVRSPKPGDWRIEDLPPGAQKLIGDLRKENGTRRTEAAEAKKLREAAEKKASEGDERFAGAVKAFTTALGLTPEPDEPEKTPEEQLGEVTQQYRHVRIELAVYRAAADHEANPDALLDSRSFMSKALALDPGSDEFDQAIADAIGEAVDNNPHWRTEQPAPAYQAPSGGDFGGGPAEPLGPDEWSVDDFRRARRNEHG